MQEKKAISLLVLVITVIVMIILAGATIVSLNNTNIINKAQSAVEKSDISHITEQSEIVKLQLIATNPRLSQAKLIEELNKNFSNSFVNGNIVIVQNEKYSITVDENLGITVAKYDSGQLNGPIEKDIWRAYNVYEAFKDVPDSFWELIGGALNKPYIKLESIYKRYTLQEYKEMYILAAMMDSEDSLIIIDIDLTKITLDDYILIMTGMTSMDELLDMAEQEYGEKLTRDEFVYQILFEGASADEILKQSGYNSDEIEAEYVNFVQPTLPNGYLTQTYTVTFPNNITETVYGYELTSYVGRYEMAADGVYEIAISNGTEEQLYAVRLYGLGTLTYEDEYYTYVYASMKGGYSVKVKDTTLSTYGPILSEIDGVPVVSLDSTFKYCTNLIETPVIPDIITNMYATFWGCSSLTEAPQIPYGVTNMWLTFRECESLTTAPEIPDSVTNIRETFYGCTNLTTAPEIPYGVTNMWLTFRECESLTTAPEIPDSVTNIRETFYGCTNLTTAPEIPYGVKNLGYTFYGCTSLTTAPEIPDSVTDMSYTFYSCTALTTAPEIPYGVTNMYAAFRGCTALTTAPEIPKSVTDMGDTFRGCTALTTAPAIPSSVTFMRTTFYGCTALTTAPEIPKSVTDMGGIFGGCSKLEGTLYINSVGDTYCYQTLLNCGTEGSGLMVVVPDYTTRQELIDESEYDSTYVTIVKELAE